MKKFCPDYLLVLLALLLVPVAVVALIPPLSEPELVKQSDIIVDGVVSAVEKVDKIYYDNCYGWQKHRALVLLEKVVKGKLLPTAIRVEYDTRVVNDKRCVGGRDSYTLAKGKRYRMHLKALKDRPNHYTFFHWMCLKER